MNEKKCAYIIRGRRSPTSVWIERRPSGGLRLRWIDPVTGGVMSQSCGKDRALARALRSRKVTELRDGLSGRLPVKTLDDLVEGIESFMAGKARSTISKTKKSLEALKDACGDRLLEHIGREAIMNFRSQRLKSGAALATINKSIREIRSSLSYAVDAGWLRANPLLRWRQGQLRETEKTVRVVEPAEFAKLLTATTDPTFRVLLFLAFHQGMRRTELCNLRWDSVELDKAQLRIINRPEAGELTKSRKNRTVPMHPTVKYELVKLRATAPTRIEKGKVIPKSAYVFVWESGEPLKPDWVTHQFARIAKIAGIAATIHDLRRSFSTLAQRAGVDRMTVKDLGGWSSVTVVEKHYTGEIQPALEKAMEKIAKSQGVA